MSELLQLALDLLGGLSPFGKALGVVIVIVVLAIVLRTNKSQAETKRAELQAKNLDDAQSDYEKERQRRIDADKTITRYLSALRYWCGLAHEQRHARLNDRQAHVLHEEKAGIEPLFLPDIPKLPPLSEENE